MNKILPIKTIKQPIACIAVLFGLLLASCASRKPANTSTVSTTTAAKAADVMANLKSKKLYALITDWIGVPYKFGGIDKRGIDCSAFSRLLEKEIYGRKLPRRSIEQSWAIKEVAINSLKEGDLIFFSFSGKEIDHVGVYLADNFFVHASVFKGVIVEDFTNPWYQKYIVKTGYIK